MYNLHKGLSTRYDADSEKYNYEIPTDIWFDFLIKIFSAFAEN